MCQNLMQIFQCLLYGMIIRYQNKPLFRPSWYNKGVWLVGDFLEEDGLITVQIVVLREKGCDFSGLQHDN